MSARLIVFICFLGALVISNSEKIYAQKKNNKRFYSGNELRSGNKKSGSFLNQQWYLGLILGVNVTEPVPVAQYSTFSPIDKDGLTQDKQYEKFNIPGIQAGLDFSYQYRILVVSLQPNFRRQTFAYANHYQWVDDNNTENTLELNYYQEHQLDYIEFPLQVKVNVLQSSIKPFAGIGGFYGLLANANKSITVDGVDRASGSSYPFNKEALSVGATDLFVKYNAGLLGSIGLNYDPGNIRLNLEIQYRFGLTNVTNTTNRFTDNRLAGIGDALDDMSLNNLGVHITILFPLRFLSNDFSSTE
jgi:hypothetical protein